MVNPLNKDKIRAQYRDYLQFGENIKLFNTLDKTTRPLYDFAKLIKSKHNYKVLFPEMVSSILHYLLIMSLVMMFDIIDNNKMQKGKTDIIDFKFKQTIDPDNALLDYANDMDMDINLMNEDMQLDDEGQPLDLIESFEFKNSNNLKVLGSFIIIYIDYINETQSTYDELTREYIKLVVTKDKQKEIENTLRSFEWLKHENNTDIRQLMLMKMRLKKVDYSTLNIILKQEYGNNYLYENEENQGDDNTGTGTGTDYDNPDGNAYDNPDGNSYDNPDGNVDGNAYDNPDGNVDVNRNRYDLDNEYPDVIGVEDLDDGDMGYDLIAVGEDD